MREIETQRVGVVMAVLLVLAQGACGGGGVTAPSSPAASLAAPQGLTGTWRGYAANLSLVWQLKQDGETITGSSAIVGNGGWSGTGGRVDGTIAGSMFEFNETHAVGTLSVAGCSAQVQGTLQISTITIPDMPRSPEIPRVPYPGHQPVVSLPPATRTEMSGSVSGHACGGDFETRIALYKD